METRQNRQKLVSVLILSILGLILLNFSLISAYVILANYGKISLDPGEKYIMNIPFIGSSKSPSVCGTALKTDGTPVENVTVSIKLSGSDATEGSDVSDRNGRYCIDLPEITKSNVDYSVYLDYDNESLILGDNDYDMHFDNNKIIDRNINHNVILSGEIKNYDAEVENGRFEVKVGHKVNSTWKYDLGDYQLFRINMEPREVYNFPNDEFNFSWQIPSDATDGAYKFLIKTSFNGKEYESQSVFFNITG
jgi:hypothetical protein